MVESWLYADPNVLQNQAGLALWQDGQSWLCGFEQWRRAQTPKLSAQQYQRLLAEEPEIAWTEKAGANLASMNLAELLKLVFAEIGKPLEFSSLVNLTMRLRRVQESVALPSGEQREAEPPPEPASTEDLAARIENERLILCGFGECQTAPGTLQRFGRFPADDQRPGCLLPGQCSRPFAFQPFGGEPASAFYRLQENVVQVFQPARSRFGTVFVATKGFLATSRAGWKTCATFLFLEVYTCFNLPPAMNSTTPFVG